MSWDFHAQQPLEFTENGVNNNNKNDQTVPGVEMLF